MKPRFFTLRNWDEISQLQKLPMKHRDALRVVAHVLPFRTNHYVIDELIDWSRVPDDPMFQLTFPQPGMLSREHFARIEKAVRDNLDRASLNLLVNEIRWELNPHPGGQKTYNVPFMNDEPVPGVQHKYKQTCLVFPTSGQTCHAYCTFCFRWAQFVGMNELKFATDEGQRFVQYVRRHREITDVLITGGDPLVMRADVLERYVAPFLEPECAHVQTIRLGTKSLSYWPYRFLAEDDSDQLLRLLERIVDQGKHLAFMAHFNHWKELSPPAVERAIRRLRSVGAVIRTQSPLVRHINDDAGVWAKMWQEQVRLGCVPYYQFVERNTGAKHYFQVPLVRALEIYQQAVRRASGLAHTARGPVMSALPGKVLVEGTAKIGDESVFVLSLIQARDPAWCRRPFFAQLNPKACWISELRPALGAKEFFFERELRALLASKERNDDRGRDVLPLQVRMNED